MSKHKQTAKINSCRNFTDYSQVKYKPSWERPSGRSVLLPWGQWHEDFPQASLPLKSSSSSKSKEGGSGGEREKEREGKRGREGEKGRDGKNKERVRKRKRERGSEGEREISGRTVLGKQLVNQRESNLSMNCPTLLPNL